MIKSDETLNTYYFISIFLYFCNTEVFLGNTSKNKEEREKKASNSTKKLVCPKIKGTLSDFDHAKAKSTAL